MIYDIVDTLQVKCIRKENLNSGGQNIKQYQENENHPIPQITEHNKDHDI